MELKDRAAYLKGLFEGVKLDKAAEETKIFEVMVDLIKDIADEVEKLKVDCCENKELIYELDEDLGEVERAVCGCDCANENDKGHGGHGSCSSCNHGDCDGDYNVHDEYVGGDGGGDNEEDGDDVRNNEKYEVFCPYCKQVICLEDDNFSEATVICPNCERELEFDYGDDENGHSNESD